MPSPGTARDRLPCTAWTATCSPSIEDRDELAVRAERRPSLVWCPAVSPFCAYRYPTIRRVGRSHSREATWCRCPPPSPPCRRATSSATGGLVADGDVHDGNRSLSSHPGRHGSHLRGRAVPRSTAPRGQGCSRGARLFGRRRGRYPLLVTTRIRLPSALRSTSEADSKVHISWSSFGCGSPVAGSEPVPSSPAVATVPSSEMSRASPACVPRGCPSPKVRRGVPRQVRRNVPLALMRRIPQHEVPVGVDGANTASRRVSPDVDHGGGVRSVAASGHDLVPGHHVGHHDLTTLASGPLVRHQD